MRRFAAALAFAAAMPGLAGAGGTPLRVVATTPDLKAFVQAVGGDRVAVESIAAPEQDPHTLELKPGHLALLAEAQLVVRVGLDHEPWLARARVRPGAKVLDVSRSVKLIQTETPRLRAEKKAHVHAFGNTHYWLDPGNALAMTGAIEASLV